MDVEKLQKINMLASELRKHNFAVSSDDAFKQAETIYETPNGEQVIVQEKAALVQQMDPLAHRKTELLLEMNNKKIEQEFNVMRNAINILAAEVENLKTELRKGTFVEAAKHKEKQAELKTEVKEPHPRQGNFQPADVDIQKMFYFGSKR